VNYHALTDGASCFKAEACPKVEVSAPQALRVVPTPSTNVNPQYPNMGLLNGAEAYHIDPRFNQGVSVTLAPSVTAINRIFEKYAFKCNYKGGYPSPYGWSLTPPLNPLFI
jgi:hypothetical protein